MSDLLAKVLGFVTGIVFIVLFFYGLSKLPKLLHGNERSGRIASVILISVLVIAVAFLLNFLFTM